MPKVALIETRRSRNDWNQLFEGKFPFDQFQLCSDPAIKKVLKRDCDIDIDTSLYDWIILVGSESLKYFTKINSVVEYSGKKVEKKFLPVINPAMLAFKPEARKTWETSKDNIIKYIKISKPKKCGMLVYESQGQSITLPLYCSYFNINKKIKKKK